MVTPFPRLPLEETFSSDTGFSREESDTDVRGSGSVPRVQLQATTEDAEHMRAATHPRNSLISAAALQEEDMGGRLRSNSFPLFSRGNFPFTERGTTIESSGDEAWEMSTEVVWKTMPMEDERTPIFKKDGAKQQNRVRFKEDKKVGFLLGSRGNRSRPDILTIFANDHSFMQRARHLEGINPFASLELQRTRSTILWRDEEGHDSTENVDREKKRVFDRFEGSNIIGVRVLPASRGFFGLTPIGGNGEILKSKRQFIAEKDTTNPALSHIYPKPTYHIRQGDRTWPIDGSENADLRGMVESRFNFLDERGSWEGRRRHMTTVAEEVKEDTILPAYLKYFDHEAHPLRSELVSPLDNRLSMALSATENHKQVDPMNLQDLFAVMQERNSVHRKERSLTIRASDPHLDPILANVFELYKQAIGVKADTVKFQMLRDNRADGMPGVVVLRNNEDPEIAAMFALLRNDAVSSVTLRPSSHNAVGEIAIIPNDDDGNAREAEGITYNLTDKSNEALTKVLIQRLEGHRGFSFSADHEISVTVGKLLQNNKGDRPATPGIRWSDPPCEENRYFKELASLDGSLIQR
jgi:hypothetical protein